MKKYFALILYRCFIESAYTGDIDICCRYYEKNSLDEVNLAIQQDKEHGYKNNDGEQVKWVLDEIIQIDEVERLMSGDEVVGFISNEADFIQKIPESEFQKIRQQYASEQEESFSSIRVKKDISALLHEITRLKTLLEKV
jgi:hypothetical protein